MWFSSFDWIVVAIAVGGFFVYRDITRHLKDYTLNSWRRLRKVGRRSRISYWI
jgi:hypothetical protein